MSPTIFCLKGVLVLFVVEMFCIYKIGYLIMKMALINAVKFIYTAKFRIKEEIFYEENSVFYFYISIMCSDF